jgi:adenylate kinase
LTEPTCIVVFGPQGSGKGTQCAEIKKKYNFPYFEMGAELRKIKESNPELAKTMDAGELAPDKVVENLVGSFVYGDSNHTILLDGYPRNDRQAVHLSTLLTSLEMPAFILDLKSYDDSILIQRMLDRGRGDDTEKTISNRLAIYNQQTVPAMENFRIAMSTKIYHLNCNQEIDVLFEEICGILDTADLPA